MSNQIINNVKAKDRSDPEMSIQSRPTMKKSRIDRDISLSKDFVLKEPKNNHPLSNKEFLGLLNDDLPDLDNGGRLTNPNSHRFSID